METPRFVLILAFCVVAASLAWTETGKLLVIVQDAQKRPVKGVEIGVAGGGGSRVTGDDGKALLPLAKATNETDPVFIQIVHSPPGKDFAIMSPFDGRTIVPSFQNKAANFQLVVVIQRGNLGLLEDDTFLKICTEQINNKNTAAKQIRQTSQGDPISTAEKNQVQDNLEAVANHYGLQPDELDKAIRAWGTKATDPYDVGLAALYDRNYPKATADLQTSLKQREEQLAADKQKVADAAFFLGAALYEQGRYPEAAVAYNKVLQIRPNDSVVLNRLGSSSMAAGDYSGAEKMFRRALEIEERSALRNDLDLALLHNDLGIALFKYGKLADAQKEYQQALEINEKALGFYNPVVAMNLSNLSEIFLKRDQIDEAKRLLERALSIDQGTLGLDSVAVAIDLGELAAVASMVGDYKKAEDLYRRDLQIEEANFGAEHPRIALVLTDLGGVLNAQRKFAEAQPLLVRAFNIKRERLLPNSPSIAVTLVNLSTSLVGIGQHEEAKCLLQEARQIDEATFGPDDPEVATDMFWYADILATTKDYAGAETLFRQAATIDEKASEPGQPNPNVARDLDALAAVLTATGHYGEAQEKFERALAIDQAVFGPHSQEVQEINRHLNALHYLSSHSTLPTSKN